MQIEKKRTRMYVTKGGQLRKALEADGFKVSKWNGDGLSASPTEFSRPIDDALFIKWQSIAMAKVAARATRPQRPRKTARSVQKPASVLPVHGYRTSEQAW